MISKPELTLDSPEVKSSPNNFYADPQGRVSELEDDEEHILFGTVEHPSHNLVEDPEERLWREAERDMMRACDPELNPHLKIFNALFGVLEKTRK